LPGWRSVPRQSCPSRRCRQSSILCSVIERAKDILLNLEKKELNRLVKERITGRIDKAPAAPAFFLRLNIL
jgi:hypothetical protein